MQITELKLPQNTTCRLLEIGGLCKNANSSGNYDKYYINVLFQILYSPTKSNNTTTYGAILTRKLDATLIQYLIRGSLWKNDEMIDLHSTSIRAKNITIDKNKVDLISIQELSKLAIKENICLGNRIDNTFYKITDNDKIYIIPSFEFIRRFFFTSPNLIKKILFGELLTTNFVDEAKSNFYTKDNIRHAFIHLRKGLHVEDLQTVSWLYYCNYNKFNTWELIKGIHLKILKALYEDKLFYVSLSCDYPFSNDIELNVKYEQINNNIYFVHHIVNSTIDFGFDVVDHDHDINFDSVEGIDRESLKSVANPKNTKATLTTSTTKIESIDASTKAATNSIPSKVSTIEKSITGNNPQIKKRKPKENQKYKSERPSVSTINTSEGSTHTGSDKKETEQPVAVSIHSPDDSLKSKDKNYLQFIESIKSLEKEVDSIQRIDLFNEIENINNTNDIKIGKAWLKRKFLIYEVQTKSCFFYLIDIESNNSPFIIQLFCKKDPTKNIGYTELATIMHLCLLNKGRRKWWNKISKDDYTNKRFDHTKQTSGEWAEKFLKTILKIITPSKKKAIVVKDNNEL